MKPPSSAKVTFYRVKDNPSKIQLICSKAQEAFKQEKRLLIRVPNFQAAQYVDALLWRLPPESFIPHVIADTSSAEWIAITIQGEQNVNQAPRLLNLNTDASPIFPQMQEIFDLFDETDPQKTLLSQERHKVYESKGLFVKIESFL